MKLKISVKKSWEENISLFIIILGFIELLSEKIHEILKWPMLFLGILSLFVCILFHKIGKRNCCIIIAVILLAAVEIVFSEGIYMTQYIWDIGICLPVALCIYSAKNVNLKKWITLYSAITLLLIIRLITSPDNYTIFYNHSRNYISVFEIFLLFLTAIIANKTKTELPNWMYYTTAIVCVIAIGRGGVIAGLLILALYILYKVHTEKKSENKGVKMLILLVVFILVCILFVFFQDYIIQKYFPRFGKTGIESVSSDRAVSKRILMWGMYINLCLESLKMFFLGANPYPIMLRVNYIADFNLHNSYLMIHVFYGVIGITAALIYLIKFIRNFYNENKVEIVIILIGFLVRSFSDYCFPGCLSGIVMWIVIFYGSNSRKKSVKKENYKLK